MVRCSIALFAILAAMAGSACFSVTAAAADAQLVTISTPRGVKQSFILVKPDKPVAAVILFAGGRGALRLSGADAMGWGDGNFLVRTRGLFASHQLLVAVVDAPSDHAGGMTAEFRMSPAHASDIEAVAAHLQKLAGVPVWLVGTSMGTFSAANGAIAVKSVSGLVLSSTITRAKPQWKIRDSHRDGVASMPLSRVRLPTLIVAHRSDGCDITPASDVPKLSARLTSAPAKEVALFDGGDRPISEPCQARSPHGFLGIEAEVVGAIAKFVKTHSVR